ncbi:hypothetical protein BD779DRAFT_1450156, partial [Infundibulicybe gibba]
IYSVQLLRINFTTYDVRREYDIVSPKTRCFAMVRSPETQDGAHPYWYARILGIFHAQVIHTGPKSENEYQSHQMAFLWVRWLGVVPGHISTRKRAQLPKIGFIQDNDSLAFGFLDPMHVIRGSHLIPTFAEGRTTSLLGATGPTAARPANEPAADDWTSFYVDIFVDRDMLMRYLGGAIGHLDNTSSANSSEIPLTEQGEWDSDPDDYEDIDGFNTNRWSGDNTEGDESLDSEDEDNYDEDNLGFADL